MERIYHTWNKWECFPAGFFNDKCADNRTREEAEIIYKKFLGDVKEFEKVLKKVIKEWPNSCEHNLTNEKMNRIAWLGQSSLTYKFGIPSKFKGGYFLMSKKKRKEADNMALKYLNLWLKRRKEKKVNLKEAGATAIANIY